MQTGYVGLLEFYYYELDKSDYKGKQGVELESHCENILIEKHLTHKGQMKIDKLIGQLTSGDTLVICSLKFLASNRKFLYKRIKAIEDKGITLKVLDMEENTFSAHIKAIEGFNTHISGMRVKKGAYNARHNKAYKVGRQRTILESDREVIRLKRSPKVAGVKPLTPTELAEEYKCSRQTIYNILKGN